jgi:hypothetical protein
MSNNSARVAQRVQNRNNRPEPMGTAAEPSPAAKPYWLLWSTGIIAAVLCTVAFALWGIYGAETLFDAMVALCV